MTDQGTDAAGKVADPPVSDPPTGDPPTGDPPVGAETPPVGMEGGEAPPDGDAQAKAAAEAEALTSLKVHTDAASTVAADKRQAERDAFWRDELQPKIQENSEHLAGVKEGLGRFVQSWNDATSDGEDMSPDSLKAVQRFIDGNPRIFESLAKMGDETLAGEHTQGHWSGVLTASKAMLEGADAEQVAKLTERITGAARGRSDPTLFTDIAKAITDSKVAKAIEGKTAEIGKAARDNVIAEINMLDRKNGKAPAEVEGKGGGGKPPDLTTVKGINQAVRAGRLNEAEATLRIQEVASGGSIGG